ncbi:MAG: hypothetical protein EOO55_00215 [Hymenobacter sp.]|nr:MAG: hypothetical protein EOO55_00215 [Hymenobacter sp.]
MPTVTALTESGWSTLKTEFLPYGAYFDDLQEVRLELAEYLNHRYNTQRLHSALGYCTSLELQYLFNLPWLRVFLDATISHLIRAK